MTVRLIGWSIVFFLLGCGQKNQADQYRVKIKGSDTLLPLSQLFAEELSIKSPELEVSVIGGGTGVGIISLVSGTSDIAMASRKLSLKEKMMLTDANVPVTEKVVALDALALIVHPDNPIHQLTREQVEAIYTGKITRWSQVGGQDIPIVAYSRESSSGTHEFFKSSLLHHKEFDPSVLMMPATGAIMQSVQQTSGAIGYVGIAYLSPQVRALSLSWDQGETFIQPNATTVCQGIYPFVRPLQYYFRSDKLTPALKFFLNYLDKPSTHQLIQSSGFIPISATADSTSNYSADCL